VVVPIMIQQAIDRGIVGQDEVRRGPRGAVRPRRGRRAPIAGRNRQRAAIVRLGARSEQALYDLRDDSSTTSTA
jgi:hypothetical protein